MAIIVENLSFGYDKDLTIKNISLNLEKGQFISLIGPNGSGKSTLLKTMLYLNNPRTGFTKIEMIHAAFIGAC